MLILVLEDRQDKIAETEHCLRKAGFHVESRQTVVSAMQALQERSFDLIISGVHLELDNPLLLVSFVRNNEKLCNLPIIFVDSHQTVFAKTMSDSLEAACQTLGITRYVAMSEFDAEELCALVSETVDALRSGTTPPPLAFKSPDESARHDTNPKHRRQG